LPAVDRLALLIAAATSGDELAEVIAADPRGLTPGVWRTAEEAGLVTTSAHGVEFTHPLLRSATYHGARAEELALVHRGIAEALAGRPERQAWHLAEALAPGSPDPGLASQLEAGAGETARRQGPEAAATALERAAELAGDGEDTARLLAEAAAQASLTGDTTWAQSLAARAVALTRDPRLRDRAIVLAGSSLVWAGAYERALPMLLPLARARPPTDPGFTLAALCSAAIAAYSRGEDRYRAEVSAAASQLADGAASAVIFSLTMCAPFRDREARTARLKGLLAPGLRSAGPAAVTGTDPRLAGTAAWLLDESELAVEALGRSLDSLTGWTGRGLSGAVTAALAWACLDTGRWNRAGSLAERVLATEMVDEAELSIVAAQTILAFLAAHRGDAAAATRLAAAAEGSAQPWSDRAALTRARHAAGLSALHDGQDDAAYELLRELLGDRGPGPSHFHCSYYAVADFALAAVRTGRRTRGSRALAGALRRLGGAPSPRIGLLIEHARALLSTRDDQAERHFALALAPGAGQWPVEQARTTLDYAEWLRRRHREREAVPLLVSARRSFELVGARPGIARVNEELRAARHSQAVPDEMGPDRTAVARAWAQMSAHQRRILRLAAQGRSNQEIAAELTLSPRTVGSHLYRAFPVLGISSRHQLRDVLTDLDAAPPQGSDQQSS
jgi:DNA-binding CsgD family transcriptional regulator